MISGSAAVVLGSRVPGAGPAGVVVGGVAGAIIGLFVGKRCERPRVVTSKIFTYVGCSNYQINVINQAMYKLFQKAGDLDGCFAGDSYCSQNADIPNCILDKTTPGKGLTFHCNGAANAGVCNAARHALDKAVCAIGSSSNDVFFCMPDNWWVYAAVGTHGATNCAPLHCILAHELAHTCRYAGHAGCFHCVCQVFPECARWKPVCAETGP